MQSPPEGTRRGVLLPPLVLVTADRADHSVVTAGRDRSASIAQETPATLTPGGACAVDRGRPAASRLRHGRAVHEPDPDAPSPDRRGSARWRCLSYRRCLPLLAAAAGSG
ncbi:hypothetical protein GCM10009760_37540 [Kitasatospora kazusensis]|uniref:Uncharacterized protein n=1 Tax=Kitasatospora kazusensis TaxID=407974 RepID=A0ABP5LH24_9ACTN